MKKLFALNDSVLFYKNYSNHITTGTIMPTLFKWQKAVRAIHYKYIPNFKPHIWFSSEFKNLDRDIDTIIIFDSFLTIYAANYIKKINPSLRVIYWFWNHIYNSAHYKLLNPKIEVWSYDPEDCKKYGLKHNTQFYFPEYSFIKTSEINIDFFFIGAEKGRAQYINAAANLIDSAGLSRNFIVANNTRKDRLKNWISYDNIIDIIRKSRCIVDMVPDVQSGLTLRPLEALYFNKKLLTNFPYIKDTPFYHPDNIFILGESRNLRDFLDTPFNHSVDSWKDYYSFDNWIKRFDAN